MPNFNKIQNLLYLEFLDHRSRPDFFDQPFFIFHHYSVFVDHIPAYVIKGGHVVVEINGDAPAELSYADPDVLRHIRSIYFAAVGSNYDTTVGAILGDEQQECDTENSQYPMRVLCLYVHPEDEDRNFMHSIVIADAMDATESTIYTNLVDVDASDGATLSRHRSIYEVSVTTKIFVAMREELMEREEPMEGQPTPAYERYRRGEWNVQVDEGTWADYQRACFIDSFVQWKMISEDDEISLVSDTENIWGQRPWCAIAIRISEEEEVPPAKQSRASAASSSSSVGAADTEQEVSESHVHRSKLDEYLAAHVPSV